MRNYALNMQRQSRAVSGIIKTMRSRLAAYLTDNRDQIIENWFAESEIATNQGDELAVPADMNLPFAFYQSTFDHVLYYIKTGSVEPPLNAKVMPISAFSTVITECQNHASGDHACLNLLQHGLSAFKEVFKDDWDADHEFNEPERIASSNIIYEALFNIFKQESQHCRFKRANPACPFHHPQQFNF